MAIHRVADGDAVFSPWLAGFVLDAFSGDSVPTDRNELTRWAAKRRMI